MTKDTNPWHKFTRQKMTTKKDPPGREVNILPTRRVHIHMHGYSNQIITAARYYSGKTPQALQALR